MTCVESNKRRDRCLGTRLAAVPATSSYAAGLREHPRARIETCGNVRLLKLMCARSSDINVAVGSPRSAGLAVPVFGLEQATSVIARMTQSTDR